MSRLLVCWPSEFGLAKRVAVQLQRGSRFVSEKVWPYYSLEGDGQGCFPLLLSLINCWLTSSRASGKVRRQSPRCSEEVALAQQHRTNGGATRTMQPIPSIHQPSKITTGSRWVGSIVLAASNHGVFAQHFAGFKIVFRMTLKLPRVYSNVSKCPEIYARCSPRVTGWPSRGCKIVRLGKVSAMKRRSSCNRDFR